jgi:thiamine-monophosphate kinase
VKISDLGEFGLIARLRARLGSRFPGVLTGIGDDTAVLAPPGDRALLATCDCLVEGIHFLRSSSPPRDIGRKAAAVNLSDIAAMGGEPRWMLVSLGLPPETESGFVEELYEGLAEAALKYGARVVGGNMASLPGRLLVDVFLLGTAPEKGALLRSGARPFDLLFVTGTPGDSAAGLALLRAGGSSRCAERARLVRRHLAPEPRVAEGRRLASLGCVSSAIDISDGLVADLGRLCEESGLGAVIEAERIPLSGECVAASRELGQDPAGFALFGGEDYELLFTAPPGSEKAVREALAADGLEGATVIGAMTGAAGVTVLREGRPVALPARTGWTHFRSDDEKDAGHETEGAAG